LPHPATPITTRAEIAVFIITSARDSAVFDGLNKRPARLFPVLVIVMG